MNNKKSIKLFNAAIIAGVVFFPLNLLAHPHHENDYLGMLGLDHIFYALVLIGFSFFLLGKFSK